MKRKKLLTVVLAAGLVCCLAACGPAEKGRTDAAAGSSSESAAEASAASEAESAAQQADSSAEADKSDEAEKDSENNSEQASEDPADVDTTADTAEGKSDDQMKKKYQGTWKLAGILYSDGSTEKAGTCTIKVNSDGSYTMKGTLSGKQVDQSGSWSLTDSKKLKLSDDELGIDSDGNLLKYTGQRDGKGYKLNYAFKRSNG